MKTLLYTLRNFFRLKNRNLIKVLSLALGLAMGCILFSKVLFESSYENFYPDNDNIYQIFSNFQTKGDPAREFPNVSGAIAPGFQNYVPGVEWATRITGLGGRDLIYDEEKNSYSATITAVDTNFFRVFPRKVLAGDPEKALSEWGVLVVSRATAEKLGGIEAAMDKVVFSDAYPTLAFTIKAVVENVPDNTMLKYDVFLSLSTYNTSSTDNWVGNDRYRGYIKVRKDMDPYGEETKAAIYKMQEDNQPLEEIAKAGSSIGYFLKPFNSLHTEDKGVKTMIILMSIVAAILIFTAVMNYILVVFSTLIAKGKEVAVRKCYGAGATNIRSIMIYEALVNLIVAVAVAALLIYLFRGTIESMIGVSLTSAFSPTALFVTVLICVAVFLASALIPARIFAKVPVSSVFRGYKESKRKWKIALLSIQLTASALFVSLLIVIVGQYNMMMNSNPGYDSTNMIAAEVRGADKKEVQSLLATLRTHPQVEAIETAEVGLPIEGASGNNVFLPGSTEQLFNIADLYAFSSGYFDIMKFNITQGRAPMRKHEVIVSSKFAERIIPFTSWTDGVVDKQVLISEHSQSETEYFTITGVYEDVRVGSLLSLDSRPSVMFWYDPDAENTSTSTLIIKLRQFDSATISEIASMINERITSKEIDVHSYEDILTMQYQEIAKYRDALFIGGLIILLIALVGLIGYTNDEINRRSSEIAIRKINGAIPSEI